MCLGGTGFWKRGERRRVWGLRGGGRGGLVFVCVRGGGYT